jgi:plasmid stabilization system protein ParE
MKREIRLSKRVSRKLDKLLLFLEDDWSIKAKKDFLLKLEESFKHIKNSLQASLNQIKYQD